MSNRDRTREDPYYLGVWDERDRILRILNQRKEAVGQDAAQFAEIILLISLIESV